MSSNAAVSGRILIAIFFSLVFSGLLTVWLLKPITAPVLQSAIYLPEPTTIRPFSLLDHHNKNFTHHDLLGRWSLLSYGYTYCPDLCPTALSSLVKFKRLTNQQSNDESLSLLFYTVDPLRDSAEQLKQYLDFFPAPFLGLTVDGESDRDSFESDLGILVDLQQREDNGLQFYMVSHGMMMYLINPQGRLQAVFKPIDINGVLGFDSKVLFNDYVAIRKFADKS